MTLYDSILKKGEDKGMQKGMQKGMKTPFVSFNY